MDIQIKYDNGQMNIRMDAFFPTSQARLKKLLKVVDLDFEHREEIMQTMQQFFQDKVNELADIKEQNKHFKAVYAGCMSDFNRSIRQKDLFLKHLEILEQRK